jgi:hypothetical protein
MGREDFRSANPTVELEDSGYFWWHVYEDYDLVEEEGRLPYFRASVVRGGEKYVEGKNYRPLIETPYLFLEFARIAEHKDNPRPALDTWIDKYGLLGLSNRASQYSLGVPPTLETHPEEDWTAHADRYPEVSVPPLQYLVSGGRGDTYDAYLLEVAKANKLLTLYEALLNRDYEKLVRCYAFHEGCSPQEWRDKWRSEVEDGRLYHRAPPVDESVDESVTIYWHFRSVLNEDILYELPPGDWNTFLMDMALRDIWRMVGAALSIFAYPSITARGDLGPLSPGKLAGHWGVRNLLGAMYLQFNWLITSGAELSRCKHCRRIISYAPAWPEREGRKPRKDKEFCDSRCRQNYHYHNRIKPTRHAT